MKPVALSLLPRDLKASVHQAGHAPNVPCIGSAVQDLRMLRSEQCTGRGRVSREGRGQLMSPEPAWRQRTGHPWRAPCGLWRPRLPALPPGWHFAGTARSPAHRSHDHCYYIVVCYSSQTAASHEGSKHRDTHICRPWARKVTLRGRVLRMLARLVSRRTESWVRVFLSGHSMEWPVCQ